MKQVLISLIFLLIINDGFSQPQIQRLIPGHNIYGFNNLDLGGSEGSENIFYYTLAKQAPQNSGQIINDILINSNGYLSYVNYDYDLQNQSYNSLLFDFPDYHNMKDSILINFNSNDQKTRCYNRISFNLQPFLDEFRVDYSYNSAGQMDEIIDIKDYYLGPPYLYYRKKKFYYSNGIPDSAVVSDGSFHLSTVHYHFSTQGQLDSIINIAKPSGRISNYLTYNSAQQIIQDSVFHDFGFYRNGEIVKYMYDNQSRLDSAYIMELDSSGNTGAFIIGMKVKYNSQGNFSSLEFSKNSGSSGILQTTYLFNYHENISVQETPSSDINIFPNPTNGILNIECDKKSMEVRILDMHGSVVYRNSNVNKIDLTGLSHGMYFLELVSEGVLHRELIMVN